MHYVFGVTCPTLKTDLTSLYLIHWDFLSCNRQICSSCFVCKNWFGSFLHFCIWPSGRSIWEITNPHGTTLLPLHIFVRHPASRMGGMLSYRKWHTTVSQSCIKEWPIRHTVLPKCSIRIIENEVPHSEKD